MHVLDTFLNPPQAKPVEHRHQAKPVEHRQAKPEEHRWHAGDMAKTVVVVGVVFFLLMIALHENGVLENTFSRSYLDNGFCISNPDAHPAFQGHAVAFYADVVTALGMWLLVWLGPSFSLSSAAVSPIRKNAVSLFGHGCGHLFLATQTTDASGSSKVFESLSLSGRGAAFVAFTAVWYGFMRDPRRSIASALGFALVHNTVQVFFLPTRFFFTHVLMAVLLNSAIRWLSKPSEEKTIYYALEAWLVDVPIVMASFGEALSCDFFLISYGGHVWFDMVVPVMFCVYFMVLATTGHNSVSVSDMHMAKRA